MIEAGEFRNTKPYPDYGILKTLEGRAMVEAYHIEEQQIVEKFKAACEEAFKVKQLKKSIRDRLWNKAWEHGHANGYTEILFWYDELAEFLKM